MRKTSILLTLFIFLSSTSQISLAAFEAKDTTRFKTAKYLVGITTAISTALMIRIFYANTRVQPTCSLDRVPACCKTKFINNNIQKALECRLVNTPDAICQEVNDFSELVCINPFLGISEEAILSKPIGATDVGGLVLTVLASLGDLQQLFFMRTLVVEAP